MSATTIKQYLDALPADRRAAIELIRATINGKIPEGYEHGMLYGGPAWYVPTSRLAETYNNQPLAIAVLGSQKNYMALYLMSVYGDSKLRTWFEGAYKASGKKLDMGKACIRFKTIDALPLDVIGDAVSRVSVDDYIATYHRSREGTASARKTRGATKTAAKTATRRKPKRASTKKTARRAPPKRRKKR